MNPIKFLLTIAHILLPALALQARVGETPAQCDERYGKPTFAQKKGDLESRFYLLSGKKIQVTFQASEAVIEVISVGPQRILGHKQAEQFSSEMGGFYLGLLSGAYGFTDAQLAALANMKRVAHNKMNSGTVDNGKLRGGCSFITSDDQSTIKFFAVIAKYPDSFDSTRVMDFQDEARVLEGKQREKDRASGF